MPISPSAAVEQAFRALDAHDWPALFAVLDPDAIADFKARQLQHLEFEQATRDEYSELSRAVPESAEVGAPRGGLLEHVFAVRDLDAFAALPASLVLRRWLMVARGRTAVGRSPERHTLGEVFERPDVAHVVYRERAMEDPDAPEEFQVQDSVRVITARRTGAEWRVGLHGGLVFDESGGFGIGYDPGRTDPTEGEEDFLARAP
jgi:hypothetical protein